MTFTHDDIQDRLIDFLYGDLDAEARTAFDAHVAGCNRCRSEVTEFARTRATARAVVRAPLAEAVPAAVRARVMEAAAGAVAARTAVGSARAARPVPRDSNVVSRWSAWLRAHWTLPMFATVAAMGALLLVRETIFREARQPLGENPPGDSAPQSEPAGSPAAGLQQPRAPTEGSPRTSPRPEPDLPLGYGELGKRAPPSDGKAASPKRRRASGSAAPANANANANANTAKAKADSPLEEESRGFVESHRGQEAGSASRADAPAPAAPERRLPRKASADDLEADEGAAASALASPGAHEQGLPPPAPANLRAQYKAAQAPPVPAAAAPPASSAAEPSPVSPRGAGRASDPAAPAVERAQRFMAARRWNDAIAAYRDLLRRFPGHTSAPAWRRKLAAAQAAAAPDDSRFATPPPPP